MPYDAAMALLLEFEQRVRELAHREAVLANPDVPQMEATARHYDAIRPYNLALGQLATLLSAGHVFTRVPVARSPWTFDVACQHCHGTGRRPYTDGFGDTNVDVCDCARSRGTVLNGDGMGQLLADCEDFFERDADEHRKHADADDDGDGPRGNGAMRLLGEIEGFPDAPIPPCNLTRGLLSRVRVARASVEIVAAEGGAA